MNMFKKNGGFTLVELIVVIAILAILAGVAIPAYSGYIEKAREAGDTQIVSAINTAIQAATAANDATVSSAAYDEDEGVSIVFEGDGADDATADYELFIGNNETVFEYYVDVNLVGGLIEGVAPNAASDGE